MRPIKFRALSMCKGERWVYGDLDAEFPYNASTHEWAKVIGNIHDNPELLNP